MAKNPKFLLSGIGASSGKAEGIVRIVSNNADNVLFHEEEILVTKITNPAMVSIMAKAAAIICDIGSLTSHPSIVSRELGIPCVVATKNGTTVLKNGMKVKVDGTIGKVYLIV